MLTYRIARLMIKEINLEASYEEMEELSEWGRLSWFNFVTYVKARTKEAVLEELIRHKRSDPSVDDLRRRVEDRLGRGPVNFNAGH